MLNTDHIEKILSIMGCAGFDPDNLDRIPVLYLAKGIWQDMFHFANEHSVYDGQASGIVLSRIMTLFGRGEFNSQTPADHFSAAFQRKIALMGRSLMFWEPGYDHLLCRICAALIIS